MKKDLLNVLKKFIRFRNIANLDISSTPFGNYNNLSSVSLNDDEDALYAVTTHNTIINLDNVIIYNKNIDWTMDLFMTIYEKFKTKSN